MTLAAGQIHSGALAGVTIALLALGACGADPGPSTLTPEAAVDELAAAFAPCESPPEFSMHPVDFMGVRVAATRTSPDGAVEVHAHSSYRPGVNWALANAVDVWFAIADPRAVAAVRGDGLRDGPHPTGSCWQARSGSLLGALGRTDPATVGRLAFSRLPTARGGRLSSVRFAYRASPQEFR